MDELPDAALHGVIANCKSELSELYAVVQQEQKRKLQRWWVAVGPGATGSAAAAQLVLISSGCCCLDHKQQHLEPLQHHGHEDLSESFWLVSRAASCTWGWFADVPWSQSTRHRPVLI